jgi:hypothetical protein
MHDVVVLKVVTKSSHAFKIRMAFAFLRVWFLVLPVRSTRGSRFCFFCLLVSERAGRGDSLRVQYVPVVYVCVAPLELI